MLETRYCGNYGGAYLPEILVSTFEELAGAFGEARDDPRFWEEYKN
jgi:tryptophan synthase beta chain